MIYNYTDHITSHRCKRPLTSDEEVEIPPKRRIKDIGVFYYASVHVCLCVCGDCYNE